MFSRQQFVRKYAINFPGEEFAFASRPPELLSLPAPRCGARQAGGKSGAVGPREGFLNKPLATEIKSIRTSKMKRFLKAFILIVLIAGAGWAYYYFFIRVPRPNVGLEFSKPSQVLVGQPFTIGVSFSNYSDQILKNARLSVILPDGISFLNGTAGQRIMEQAIGDIGPGSINQQSFNLIVLSGSQTLKHLDAKLSYETAGSSAEFESQSGLDIPVGQSAITLSFDIPQNVFSGADFDLTVRYENNSSQDFKNLRLRLDYPPLFKFKKAAPEVSTANNQWDFGGVPGGASSSVTISGSLTGPEGSYYNFRGIVTADFLGQSYTISEQTANISLSASPLSITPSVNNSSDYISRFADDLNYKLRYRNNSNAVFENVTIKATLSGELFDFSTLRTNGSFDPATKTLTWFTANTPALAALLPGQEGDVTFEIKLKNNFPLRRLSDKNYVLKLHNEINSPTVPQGTKAQQTISIADLETKVAGQLGLNAKAFWRDASSGILNKGPYPPVVNQPTQYTIHWQVANYATDVSGAEVSAYLQSGSRWTGVVKSNTDSQPTYNPSSGKVIWNIGNIMATKGVINAPLEAIFQIELTPAANQINQLITFLGETAIQAQDTFTGLTLNVSTPALTTALPDDTTITTQNRGVKQ